jgi:hypothetical protein
MLLHISSEKGHSGWLVGELPEVRKKLDKMLNRELVIFKFI